MKHQWPSRFLGQELERSVTRFCSLVHTTETVELELIDAIDGVRVLPIVLDEINVVRSGEKACEG